MALVFIHGVPDSARVWSRMVPLVGRDDVEVLSLPGFASAAPAGFPRSKEAYLAWLIEAFETLHPPHDVIAHDWGFILTMRLLTLRPDLVRSWAGGGAPFTPDYRWHTTARLWQTPSAGEKAMERFSDDLACDMLKRAGVEDEWARETAERIDTDMKRSILALYRSGTDVFREWGSSLAPIAAPGLVIWGEADIYSAPVFGQRIADVTGAAFATLPCGHWWQLACPDAAVSLIRAFWDDAGL